jgi:amino acid adenylation domain-containing protein
MAANRTVDPENPLTETFPQLSATQKSMLWASREEGGEMPYLIQIQVPFHSTFEPLRWQEAWEFILATHPILRLSSNGDEASFLSQIPPSHIPKPLQDTSSPTRSNKENLASERHAFTASSAITEKNAPLLRSRWACGSDESTWTLTIHHSLVDGTSIGYLFEEIVRWYSCPEFHFKEEPPNFFKHESQRSSREKKATRRYAKTLPPVDMIAGKVSPCFPKQTKGKESSSKKKRFNVELSRALRSAFEASPEKPSTLIHAAWALTLRRLTASQLVWFGTLRHGRKKKSDSEKGIGPYFSTLPLVIDTQNHQLQDEFLKTVSAQWEDLKNFEYCSLDSIQSELGRTLEVETYVNIMGTSIDEALSKILGEYITKPVTFTQTGGLPICLNIDLNPELRAYVTSASPDISDEALKSMGEIWRESLLVLLQLKKDEQPVSPIKKIATLSIRERFEAVASQNPEKIALSSSDSIWTFEDLSRESDYFSNLFSSVGIQRGEIIPICNPRSFKGIAAIYGAIKFGAAFLPLSDELPTKKTDEIIKKSGACHFVSKDGDIQSTGQELVRMNPSGLAYVIATSGTTGQPKLVMVSHAGLENMIDGYEKIISPGLGDKRFQSASSGSDTFVLEVILYLSSGAALHLDPDLLSKGVDEISLSLAKNAVTLLGLPSSFWKELVLSPRKFDVPSLRAIICSMERTDPETLKVWREGLGKNMLWINAYGPSEASCVVSLHLLRPGDPTPDHEVPIGKSLPGVVLKICDLDQTPLPQQVIGEILVEGVQVGLGYLDDRKRTEEKFFLNNPHGVRSYRTGDLGYVNSNGEIVFVGRVDNQVKIRGSRIELEEVEICLSRFPSIFDAAVLTEDTSAGTSLLGVYVSESDLAPSNLRRFLSIYLSSPAIPRRFLRIAKIPRSAAGKINRKLLKKEILLKKKEQQVPCSSLFKATTIEDKICHIFEQILNISEVAQDDDFFQLGADSLAAVQLVSALEKEFGTAILTSQLYPRPTPLRLAFLIQEEGGKNHQLNIFSETDFTGEANSIVIAISAFGVFPDFYHAFLETIAETHSSFTLEVKIDDLSHYEDAVKRVTKALEMAILDPGIVGRPLTLLSFSTDALLVWDILERSPQIKATTEKAVLIEPTQKGEEAVKSASLIQLLQKSWLRFTFSRELPLRKRLKLVCDGITSKLRFFLGENKHSAVSKSAHPTISRKNMLAKEYVYSFTPKALEVPLLLARSVDGAYFSNLKLYDDYWKTRTSCFKTLDLVGVHLELLKEPQVHILASQFYKSRDN